ncbi:MAG: hypothetical protein QXO40_00225 [Candidatus Aenigmatarchaeota archaeon]
MERYISLIAKKDFTFKVIRSSKPYAVGGIKEVKIGERVKADVEKSNETSFWIIKYEGLDDYQGYAPRENLSYATDSDVIVEAKRKPNLLKEILKHAPEIITTIVTLIAALKGSPNAEDRNLALQLENNLKEYEEEKKKMIWYSIILGGAFLIFLLILTRRK